MRHDHSNSNSNTHLLLLACCLIPLILILAVGVLGVSLGPLTPLLPFALMLLCPLMMFFLMREMGHGNGQEHHVQPPGEGESETPRK